MKTVKPMKVGVLCRPFSTGGRFHLAVGAMLYVPMPPGEGVLTEPTMWKMIAAEFPDAMIDPGMPKSRGEWIVAGRACAPGGVAAPAVNVRVKVGDAREKRLRVTGDRYWDPATGAVSSIRPFTEMPVGWAQAYGGKGFARNPLGKGSAPVAAEGRGEIRWLPNVEDPERPVRSPDDRPEPVGLMAYDLTWPQRNSTAGTYDEAWLKTLFPGPAADFDWSMYNGAPRDQWIEGYFRGDERYVIEGMHPTRPVIEGALPGLRARAFVTLKAAEGEAFREVALRLETLYFVPHRERVVMMFRGTVEVQEDDASDVLHLLLASERVGAPRDVAHYADCLARRLDKVRGGIASLRESELMAEGSELRPPEVALEDRNDVADIMRTDALLQKNMRRRHEREAEAMKVRLKEAGLDPGAVDPALFEVPPDTEVDLENIPEIVEREMSEMEAKEREILQKREEVEAEARALCASAGMDYEAVTRKARQEAGGPPRRTSRMMMEELRAAATEANLGEPVPEVEAHFQSESFLAGLDRSDAERLELYRRSAHVGEPARRLEGAEAQSLRARVEGASSRAFRDLDLTGADLSRLDLRGADFTGALLESSSFAGSDLTGATFDRAVVARADFTGAVAREASFREANLGAAVLHGCDLTGARFVDATLSYASLRDAVCQRARFEKVFFFEVALDGADFTDAVAPDLLLHESDLSRACFARADLSGATLLKARGAGVRFTGAKLTRAALVECALDDADLTDVDAENLRVVMGTSLRRARLVGARLDSATMRDTALEGADFSRAQGRSLDLSEARLARAKFYQAKMREARFVRADLTDAVMMSLDAIDALFQSADITRVDFTGANLFGADFGRVRGRAKGMMDAVIGRLQMYPRRPE